MRWIEKRREVWPIFDHRRDDERDLAIFKTVFEHLAPARHALGLTGWYCTVDTLRAVYRATSHRSIGEKRARRILRKSRGEEAPRDEEQARRWREEVVEVVGFVPGRAKPGAAPGPDGLPWFARLHSYDLAPVAAARWVEHTLRASPDGHEVPALVLTDEAVRRIERLTVGGVVRRGVSWVEVEQATFAWRRAIARFKQGRPRLPGGPVANEIEPKESAWVALVL